MKKALVLVATTLMATSAFAMTPAMKKTIDNVKSEFVRTKVSAPITAAEANPCEAEGSVQVAIQIKERTYNRLTNNMNAVTWKTVKTISVDKDGIVMEECAE